MALISLLLYIHIGLVFSVLYLVHEMDISRTLLLIPDALAGLILALTILYAARRSDLSIPGKYVVWLLLAIGVIIVGVAANQVQPGAIFWGVRKYIRYMPLFLVPIIVDFPLKTRLNHFRLYLLLAVAQLPIAGYQYLTSLNHKSVLVTGDTIRGTLLGAGTLTVFLLGMCLVLTAAYVKRTISLATYLLILPLLFIPTLLNETTAAIVLLPIAIAFPFLLEKRKSIWQLLVIGGVASLLVFVFISAYSNIHSRWSGDVTNAISEQGASYLYRGADAMSRADGGREQSEIGRIDSMIIPFLVHDDYLKWTVGVGIGNASGTSNRVLRGEYFRFNERYGIDFTTNSHILWELGLLGFGLVLTFFWFIYRDARSQSDGDGPLAAISLASLAMIPYILVSMAYTNLVNDLPTVVGLSLLFGNVVWVRMKDARAKAAVAGRGQLRPAFDNNFVLSADRPKYS